MKSKKILIIFILFNIIFFSINTIIFIKANRNYSNNVLDEPKISQNYIDNQKNINLQELIEYLNSSPDADLISKQFKLVKIASDPLYELNNLDSTENKLLSVSYGIEGVYKLDENTSIKITIIIDDTLTNGNYIFTSSEQSFESSYYMIENTFLIFEIYIDYSLKESEIIDAMINAIQFKQKFYNHYNSFIQVIKHS